jgi:hypothetical protein
VWFAANNLVELKKKDFGKANSIDGVWEQSAKENMYV